LHAVVDPLPRFVDCQELIFCLGRGSDPLPGRRFRDGWAFFPFAVAVSKFFWTWSPRLAFLFGFCHQSSTAAFGDFLSRPFSLFSCFALPRPFLSRSVVLPTFFVATRLNRIAPFEVFFSARSPFCVYVVFFFLFRIIFGSESHGFFSLL